MFITESMGLMHYKRMPKGLSISTDAYGRCYEEITKDIPNHMRCMDDMIIYAPMLEELYVLVTRYISTTGQAGIIYNPHKFKL